MDSQLIFKIMPYRDWQTAVAKGLYLGAPVDLADGFIHFSSGTQVTETAAKHFRGQTDQVIVAFASDDLGSELKWEPSRGGDLFPHLYDTLDPAKAVWHERLDLDDDGVPIIPERVRRC